MASMNQFQIGQVVYTIRNPKCDWHKFEETTVGIIECIGPDQAFYDHPIMVRYRIPRKLGDGTIIAIAQYSRIELTHSVQPFSGGAQPGIGTGSACTPPCKATYDPELTPLENEMAEIEDELANLRSRRGINRLHKTRTAFFYGLAVGAIITVPFLWVAPLLILVPVTCFLLCFYLATDGRP